MASIHEPGGLMPATWAIAGGRPDGPGEPLNTPIMPATSLHPGAEISYTRAGSPTWAAFEEVLGGLEGGRAWAFASGLAAMTAAIEVLLAEAPAEVPVVTAPEVTYSGTSWVLESLAAQGRIDFRRYRATEPDAFAAEAAVTVIETPANPSMTITDIARVAERAHLAGGRVVCDNTFATPLLTRPLDLGADIVVHSASKYLAGHSDALIGAAVAREDGLAQALFEVRTRTGGTPGVLEAFLTTRGVRTLALRMERSCANAAELARRLQAHAEVAWVRYPGLLDDPGHDVAARQMRGGFGAVVAFAPVGTPERAEAICLTTQLWTHATSLGGIESTLERRRRHDFESDLTPPELIRLSVGCEDVEDLWSDLAAALGATGGL